ncbi:hypothetical protein AAMO2058_000412100 [Amorphochlora amoebiformis]
MLRDQRRIVPMKLRRLWSRLAMTVGVLLYASGCFPRRLYFRKGHPLRAETQLSKVDESLYSRQLYVLGVGAQLKLQKARVLVIGDNPVGIETAKNLILAGAGAVHLSPGERQSLPQSPEDHSNSMLRGMLPNLNPYVEVRVYNHSVGISNYSVVIVTSGSTGARIRINRECRRLGACFVSGEAHGLFCEAFCDFLDKFVVYDQDGEKPRELAVVSVTNPPDSEVITVQTSSRHKLNIGDYLTINSNHGRWRVLEIMNPYSFQMEPAANTKEFRPERGDFIYQQCFQVKMPKCLRFLPLECRLKDPGDFLETGVFGGVEKVSSLVVHCGFQALNTLESHLAKHSNPDVEQFERFLQETRFHLSSLREKHRFVSQEFDFEARHVLWGILRGAWSDIPPITSFLGGFLAQEALKAISRKFTPLQQWMLLSAPECLPDLAPPTCREIRIVNFSEPELISSNLSAPETSGPPVKRQKLASKYMGQKRAFGDEIQRRLGESSVFLVGAGAIGCEMLKIFAQMGIGTSSKGGSIHVTDMDTIERSNLNRQFLFRPKDVGSFKAKVAAEAACALNPDVNIKAYTERVGPETEHVFSANFYKNLSLFISALDNVQARVYLDDTCLLFKKPMIDAGTQGSKGSTQSVIPHLSENYAAQQDPPGEGVPMCTVKNFPFLAEHTIQWAKEWFVELFQVNVKEGRKFLKSPEEFIRSVESGLEEKGGDDRAQSVLKSLIPLEYSYKGSIMWGIDRFREEFAEKIFSLLSTFPPDLQTDQGTSFWSGTKRVPRALSLNVSDPMQLRFIRASARIISQARGIDIPKHDEALVTEVVRERQGFQNSSTNTDPILQLRNLAKSTFDVERDLREVEFDKDNDSNFQMDFITSAANLRARNYRIREATDLEAKQIAGSIIPAIATTTALVSGLACLEIYKLLQNKSLSSYRNNFVNLALPLLAASEPAPPKRSPGSNYTIWDHIECQGRTIKDLSLELSQKHGWTLDMVSCDNALLYATFFPLEKRNIRYTMPLTQLLQEVLGKEKARSMWENGRYVELVASASDEEGRDVEVPVIRLSWLHME